MKNTAASCDIIIPAYNNATVVADTLAALFEQRTDPAWRFGIIMSDDGSTDDTVTVIQKMQPRAPWPLRVITNPHRGAAHARNCALEVSRAPTILFLGADILLRPLALAAHTDFHIRFPSPEYAALGHVAWDPRLPPTPYMAWMVHGGPQNDFDALLGQTEVDPRHYFYGSHLSLKRAMLEREKWPETFTAYGWEDLDLGRRLATQGLILKPHFAARSVHRHSYTVSDIIHRQRAAGQGLLTYQKLHPTISLLPPRTWRTHLTFFLLRVSGAAAALRLVLRYSGKRWTTPRLFFMLSTVEYWRGILKTQRR